MRVPRALEHAAEAILADGDAWAEQYWLQQVERLVDDYVIALRTHGRILEVGSSPYITTLALTRVGRKVTGIDIDPTGAPAGVEVRRCDIEREQLPVRDGEFDVILFSEVFEHLRIDPLFTLSELRRALRPGGILLLTTPNLRSLRGVLRLVLLGKAWAVGAYPPKEWNHLRTRGWMGHVREYTALEVTGMLDAAGFAVGTVMWRRKAGHWLWRLIEGVVPPSRPYMTLIARPIWSTSSRQL